MTTDAPTKRRRKKPDPRAILEAIAADPTASAALRYRAASRLLAADQREASKAAPARPTEPELDPINRRALEMAAARNGRIH